MSNTNLVISNITVRQLDNLYCLNDFHKASGKENKNKPSLFMQNKQTLELCEEIKKAGIPTFKTIRGTTGGTYTCKELVYSYAMWISPAFHLKVIRTFDRVVQEELQSLKQPTITFLGLTPEQQHQVKSWVDQKVANAEHVDTAMAYARVWKKTKAHFKVAKYQDINPSQLPEVKTFIDNLSIGDCQVTEQPLSSQPIVSNDLQKVLNAAVSQAGNFIATDKLLLVNTVRWMDAVKNELSNCTALLNTAINHINHCAQQDLARIGES